MNRRRQQAALAALLVLSVACATVGAGDPVVVRAEDVLTNSLTVYHQAMIFHYGNPLATPPILGHSTQESPAVYHAIESFRVKFPVAWNALDTAKRNYKANKSAGTSSVDAALAALTALLSAVQPLIGG